MLDVVQLRYLAHSCVGLTLEPPKSAQTNQLMVVQTVS